MCGEARYDGRRTAALVLVIWVQVTVLLPVGSVTLEKVLNFSEFSVVTVRVLSASKAVG